MNKTFKHKGRVHHFRLVDKFEKSLTSRKGTLTVTRLTTGDESFPNAPIPNYERVYLIRNGNDEQEMQDAYSLIDSDIRTFIAQDPFTAKKEDLATANGWTD
jgi:hypothetical protein